MKIGILTYHRSHNYGALLQAVALRHILYSFGHEVYFVDYWPEYHRNMYGLIDYTYLREVGFQAKCRYLVSRLLKFRNIQNRRRKFEMFIRRYVVPYCRPCSESFDLIVCGSDQIWRKQPRLKNSLNPVYFGAGDTHAAAYASYAASMGVIGLSPEDKKNIKSWLGRFQKLSVRESELKKVLERECELEDVEHVLDPTLLLTATDWKSMLPVPEMVGEKYVLFYDLMKDSFNVKAIEEYTRCKGFRLITLRGGVHEFFHRDGVLPCEGPLEMMGLIAHAECVFTSSFHGLAFSVVFNRPFIASFKQNAGRAESLLRMLGVPERLLAPKAERIPEFASIDYGKVNEKLDRAREESVQFLKSLNIVLC